MLGRNNACCIVLDREALGEERAGEDSPFVSKMEELVILPQGGARGT